MCCTFQPFPLLVAWLLIVCIFSLFYRLETIPESWVSLISRHGSLLPALYCPDIFCLFFKKTFAHSFLQPSAVLPLWIPYQFASVCLSCQAGRLVWVFSHFLQGSSSFPMLWHLWMMLTFHFPSGLSHWFWSWLSRLCCHSCLCQISPCGLLC